MTFIKQNVSYKEFVMHDFIYNLSGFSNGILNVPKIIDYDAETQTMTMENIPHMCVSDYYGEKSSNISPNLFAEIREVIRFLYDNHIIYPDVTGYNFIEYDNKLWIIDFEHSDFKTHQKTLYVEEFVEDDNYNEWNSWFA